MKLLTSISEVKNNVDNFRKQGEIIGFVPTMGALHQGHISLVQKAKEECDIVITSIFVNPTQFNDRSDLEKYPRTLEKDVELLTFSGNNLLFYPSEEEMYPKPDLRKFDFGLLEKVMEGAHRPGHFNGVAQVVSKLFDIVNPHKAYFGQKDFQQLAIIRQLVKQNNYPIEIIACPTLREKDGLAMSSRNIRLTETEREIAPLIYGTLVAIKEFAAKHPVSDLKKTAQEKIGAQSLMELEYFEIVNAETLQPVEKIEAGKCIACIAVKLGSVRLIDNILL